MKCAALVVAAALSLTLPASSADAVVELTLDGRPVDRTGDVAVLRHGTVFADAVDLTKCFDGLITLSRNGAATITIGSNTATFTPGSARATVNETTIALPAAPFTRNGDLYVPLQAFITTTAGAKVRLGRGRHADIRVNAARARYF